MTAPYKETDSSGLLDLDAGAVLDSHVHFWDPQRLSYAWLSEAPPLDRPFTPDNFAALHSATVSAIFVEAGVDAQHSVAEVEWVRDQARRCPWILGAVAHVPLEDPVPAEAAIRRYADDPFVVGVRRNVQDEAAGFTTDADFRSGIRQLGEAGLPFDACVREYQLPELVELSAACPETTIVLDHLGKPQSATAGWTPWREALRRLAGHDNVACKLSGLATEIDADTPRPFVIALLREALDVFGPERCLYGGDWPVMTLATSYGNWLGLVREALTAYPAAVADAVLRTNAQRVYRLQPVPFSSTPEA
jgi:L-fuconolactonase